MKKQTLMVAFGVMIILTFIVGTFSVLMYSSDSAKPTPSPAAQAAFKGGGQGTGTVTKLENQIYAFSCNSTQAQAALEALPGFTLVYKVSENAYAAQINENASMADARDALEPLCDALLMRVARLNFAAKITLYTLDSNETRDLQPVNLNGQPAYVDALGVEVGDEVPVGVYAEIDADGVARLIIEQAAADFESETLKPEADGNNTVNETSGNSTN
ncbi:MAG: hypothetical protein WC607_02150 [Candidatus Micrarchaeia archaeon]